MRLFVFALLLLSARAALGWSRAFFSTSSDESEADVATQVRIEFAAEFLLMVIGRHGYFVHSLLRPASYDDAHVDERLDRDRHLTAMAIVRMLQRLHSMERMDALLAATVAEAVDATGADYPSVVNAFYARFAPAMANDSLAAEFERTKLQVQVKWDALPATRKRYTAYRAPQSEQSLRTLMWRLATEDADLKKLVICTLFLDGRNSSNTHRAASVNGTLNLVKRAGVRERVERIFGEALDEVAEQQPLSSPETIANEFLARLTSKLREDQVLNPRPSSAG